MNFERLGKLELVCHRGHLFQDRKWPISPGAKLSRRCSDFEVACI